VKLSNDASRFLKRLLEPNPRRRLNAAQALEQSWIVSRTIESRREPEVLPTEVVRSAHRKVTAQRKQVDPKVEQHRNRKLKKIDEDYSRGIARGKRLGDTSMEEEFLSKPEFMRRENKLVTAPSSQKSLSQTFAQMDPERVPERCSEPVGVWAESEASSSSMQENTFGAQAAGGVAASSGSALRPAMKQRRCHSLCHRRRFSYIGNMSSTEENSLHALYLERNTAPAAIDADSAVPEAVPEIRETDKSFNSVVATEELT